MFARSHAVGDYGGGRDLFVGGGVLHDLLELRGQPVVLTFNPCSKVYSDVVSKCRILHGRYLSTPWLCSPHLQTVFLQYFGNPPVVNYRRQILTTSDGGTLALDWVKNAKVKKQAYQVNDALALQQDEKNPILIIIPGLTSASDSAYIKHLAFNMAKRGWNVVVSNHRGLGGVSITSDCFYNGGWTEDVRKVIDYIHCQYPEAPLFVVGTSIGANILVKYLAEDGINVPIIGAAAICSPWDLLICDRFMTRKLVQRLYNKALTIGLKDYAQSHEAVLSRLSNWEGVKKTVDTYYRRCSASNFVGSVMVPLLCISSLDDPVCTREAIPWDECRLNTNVVLATTQHGGHLPFFEGLAAKSVWWVRAVDEFFDALQSSPLSHRKKSYDCIVKEYMCGCARNRPYTDASRQGDLMCILLKGLSSVISVSSVNPLESSIDHAPYVHVSEDGMVTAVSEEVAETIEIRHQENADENKTGDEINAEECVQEKQSTDINPTQPERDISDLVAPVKKCLTQLSRQNRKSLWLLAYIAIITTWPVVGSALTVFLRKKFKIFSPEHRLEGKNQSYVRFGK
ncbi:hypothetical protein DH2020_044917 [Rehmannia glutinosa]|uniref:Serine aminopeptidase S33 domain-containing protein n=1 Tax=Rehmannia glutinosa TaxID=99300 RepID=A0ABR0UGP9_REHGL